LLSIDITQPITITTLSDLYRHSRIAKGLQLSIEDFNFILLITLNGQPVKSLKDLLQVIDFVDWLSKTPLKVADLIFILHGTENSSQQYKLTADALIQNILSIQK